jgi:hypothetical protein
LNAFVIDDEGNEKQSTSYPIKKLMDKSIAISNANQDCIGDNQQMCLNWDTTCPKCTTTFPTELDSNSICCIGHSTQIKETGLFAKRDIKANEYICRYVGQTLANGTIGEYVVIVNNQLTIDALQYKAYLARYANHSCKPNCILQKVSRDVIPSVLLPYGNKEFYEECFIKATVQIAEGEEITFDYGKSFAFIKECKCEACSANE